MNIFVSGGAKNGKSTFAEEKAREMAHNKNLPLYYVATMIPHDKEDEARIRRHVISRAGKGFTTIEQGLHILEVLREYRGVFLIDSVTALLSNEMFRENGFCDYAAGERLKEELITFVKKSENTVFVSDYIYSDANHFEDLSDEYRKALADIDRALAEYCDKVYEVSFGQVKEWK